MKYTYTAAWSVIGGLSLQEESTDIVLAEFDDARFILTRKPDEILHRVDESVAAGRLMLLGHGGVDFQTALATELEKIKTERKSKIGTQVVLIFQAHGEIEAAIREPSREHSTCIVTFDAFEKSAVSQLYASKIEAMKVAIAIESEVPSQFVSLAEGAYLLSGSGKPIYSITFSLSAQGFISKTISKEISIRISERYALLNKNKDIDSVERLFSQMAEQGADRLKAFLSGWAALEILIAKSFNEYEDMFLAPLANSGQPVLRERFLGRLKQVMKDKYRLADKFIAITAVLFPDIKDEDAKKNYSDFCKLKSIRDSIFHGRPFSEKDLPVFEMATLLRKYVIAIIEVPGIALKKNNSS